MTLYQLTCLISPQTQEDEAQALFNALKKNIQKNGEIKKQEPTLRVRLAYPVKKQKEAFFSCLEFKLNQKDIIDLDQQIAKEPKIIRHLIVKVLLEPERDEEEQKTKPRPEVKENEEEPKTEAKKESPAVEKADLKKIDEELERALNE